MHPRSVLTRSVLTCAVPFMLRDACCAMHHKGDVYTAEVVGIAEPVAVKRMKASESPTARETFEQEALHIFSIGKHEHVLQLHGVCLGVRANQRVQPTTPRRCTALCCLEDGAFSLSSFRCVCV